MGNKSRRIAKMTSIFLVLETVFMYYAISVTLFGSYPKTLFKYSPGLGYIVKTFFPNYWYGVYHPVDIGHAVITYYPFNNQVMAEQNFILALWISLIVASIIVATVFVIKLNRNYVEAPKVPHFSS